MDSKLGYFFRAGTSVMTIFLFFALGCNSSDGEEEEEEDNVGDSCQYANDGECDEPEYCLRGTDTSDCALNPPSPTCSDGAKNGDEEGIDCGGGCNPCVSPAAPGQNGGACSADEDCIVNVSESVGMGDSTFFVSECVLGEEFPGGYCLAPSYLGSCLGTVDSVNIAEFFHRSDVCIDTCDSQMECRDGYVCKATGSIVLGSICLSE